MICEDVRSALRTQQQGQWPSGLDGHLAGCDDCAAFAVELVLHTGPAVSLPVTFAADVARRARLAAPPPPRRMRGVTAALLCAGAVSGLGLAWLGTSAMSSGAIPAAVLLLACGEAIVLAAWTLPSDVVRTTSRS